MTNPVPSDLSRTRQPRIASLALLLAIAGCASSNPSSRPHASHHTFTLAGPDEPLHFGPDVIRLRYMSSGHLWYLGIFFCPDLSAGETMAWAFQISSGDERVELFMRRLASIVDVPALVDPTKRHSEAEKYFYQGIREFLQMDEKAPVGDLGLGNFSRLVALEGENPAVLKVVALTLLGYLRFKGGDVTSSLRCDERSLLLALSHDVEPFLKDDILRLCLQSNLARRYRAAGELEKAKTLFRTILDRYRSYRATAMYEECEYVLGELEK